MGLEGAVRLGMRRELEAIEDPDERAQAYEPAVAAAYERGKGLSMAAYFEIDDVIDPADSRRWIATLFDDPTPPQPTQAPALRRHLVARTEKSADRLADPGGSHDPDPPPVPSCGVRGVRPQATRRTFVAPAAYAATRQVSVSDEESVRGRSENVATSIRERRDGDRGNAARAVRDPGSTRDTAAGPRAPAGTSGTGTGS